jgi:hypothetical protein
LHQCEIACLASSPGRMSCTHWPLLVVVGRGLVLGLHWLSCIVFTVNNFSKVKRNTKKHTWGSRHICVSSPIHSCCHCGNGGSSCNCKEIIKNKTNLGLETCTSQAPCHLKTGDSEGVAVDSKGVTNKYY